MDLDDIAERLYGLTPDEFTSARNAAAEQARRAGDRDLARAITSLRRPTVPAWVVNQMVRRRHTQVELLLALGRTMRETSADLDGDRLRVLTRQRHQVVSELVGKARELAGENGRRLSDDAVHAVRHTFEATLSDPGSADAVAAGRLSDALQVSGFGIFSEGAAAPGRRPPVPKVDAVVGDLDAKRQQRVRQRRQAESEVERAQEEVRRTQQRSERADAHLRDAEELRGRVQRQVDRLQDELAAATEQLTRAVAEHQAARSKQAKAQRKAKDASARLERATARLRRPGE